MLPDIPLSKIGMSFPVHTKSIPDCVNLNNLPIIDPIIPGIYHFNGSQKNFTWTTENLRSHGFTHIIEIDKHISYLQNASFANSAPATTDTTVEQQQQIQNDDEKNYSNFVEIFKRRNLWKEFEILDLNFGEESYLTTVLPNCYKAVKFINKTLQNGGAILIIDHNNNLQKCLTIITAYIMYKNNLCFNDAFLKLQKIFKKAELDGFFIRQLYEYEPILQVHRAQARGHSCSREMRSAILKRKQMHDDPQICSNDYNINCYETYYYDDIME